MTMTAGAGRGSCAEPWACAVGPMAAATIAATGAAARMWRKRARRPMSPAGSIGGLGEGNVQARGHVACKQMSVEPRDIDVIAYATLVRSREILEQDAFEAT